jgi:hypothetical protein
MKAPKTSTILGAAKDTSYVIVEEGNIDNITPQGNG